MIHQKLHQKRYMTRSNSPEILLVGSGRLARHLKFYFKLEGFHFKSWSRSESHQAFLAKASRATHVLLAISDSALAPFYAQNFKVLLSKTCVHFSGALLVRGAFSAHPLMTFAQNKYDLKTYRKIHFVLEDGSPPLIELIPGLKNKSSRLKNELRPLYHALCTMSGNFTVILWEHIFGRFKRDLKINPKVLEPYLDQITQNLRSELHQKTPQSVLTGPLVRGDRVTIDRHLATLKHSPSREIYEAFVRTFEKGIL